MIPSQRVTMYLTSLIIMGGVLSNAPVFAQGFSWPENPENLTVLPESVKGEQLGAIMRNFSSALGVRCSYCHVGQGPLSEYDFVSDEKLAKEKTRLMMKMTRAINQDHIAGLAEHEEEPQDRIRVTCMTCHRTVAKPMSLEDVLAETFETDGIEMVLTSYDELRDNYYGGFAYDFRPGTLTKLAQQLAQDGDMEAALQVVDKELSLHDDFADAYGVKGGMLAAAGRTEEALAAYEKGLEVAPERGKRFFRQLIQDLQGN